MNPNLLDEQTPPQTRRAALIKSAPAVVLMGAMLLQIWQACTQEMIPTFTVHWWHGTESQFVHGWKSYDSAVLDASGGSHGGDVALGLLKLDPAQNSQLTFAQGLVCRGSYTLYPRRVWAADEKTILNNGRDAIQARFNPTSEWLGRHDVRGIMVGTPLPSGEVISQLVPPIGADQ